ncbi:MAG: formylglycine-generating enzyme family protein, partial [Parvularculaceae bacterium]
AQARRTPRLSAAAAGVGVIVLAALAGAVVANFAAPRPADEAAPVANATAVQGNAPTRAPPVEDEPAIIATVTPVEPQNERSDQTTPEAFSANPTTDVPAAAAGPAAAATGEVGAGSAGAVDGAGRPGDEDPIAQLAWAATQGDAPTDDGGPVTAGGPFGATAPSLSPTRLAVLSASPSDPQAAEAPTGDVDAAAAAADGLIRDCPSCPPLTLAPPGSFAFGSPPGEAVRDANEGPQKTVTFAAPFAIGVREVTFEEWGACVADGGCGGYAPPEPGWGRGARPVINVSHADALDYVRWLSAKTGEAYRLPSEAEWEYAARAGSAGPFAFGRGVSTDQANYNGAYPYAGEKGDYRKRTTPAGSFPANAFGLHDVHGNVREWTADCWTGDHGNAPADGRPSPAGDCGRRVAKGGAWNVGAWRLRSAYRRALPATTRDFATGFRVARDAP